jgi:hypothetical protein
VGKLKLIRSCLVQAARALCSIFLLNNNNNISLKRKLQIYPSFAQNLTHCTSSLMVELWMSSCPYDGGIVNVVIDQPEFSAGAAARHVNRMEFVFLKLKPIKSRYPQTRPNS